MNDDFRLEGDKIFSNATGDLVATVEDGAVRMQSGKNAMTKRVKAFYEEFCHLPQNSIPAAEPQENFDEEEMEEVNTHLLHDEDDANICFGDAPRPAGGTSAPPAEPKAACPKSIQALAVWDIPERELPHFAADTGVATPEFKAFVQKYHLTQGQVVELVQRLQRKFR